MGNLITTMNELDRVFDLAWGGSYVPAAAKGTIRMQPRADIEELEGAFRLRMDLPGVKREDLRVEVEDGVLTIEAERKTEQDDSVQVLHSERATHAEFSRRFTLSKSVVADGIQARLADGVLELTIPKTEKALPRRINVE